MGTLVNYSTEKGVAFLTLSDPPVNAYTHEMLKELDAAILEARFDNDVHVIVVTGHGDRYFCAGANINMLREADSAFKYYFCLHANETLLRLEATPKLTIAALNGHTMGGGLEVALACDLRVARGVEGVGHELRGPESRGESRPISSTTESRGAIQIGLPEVNLGVLPGTGTQRLTRAIGKARALQMMVEGATLTPEQARDWGLVNKVWHAESHEAFMRKVRDYAHEFTPPGRASFAVGRIKSAVQGGEDGSLSQGLSLERELQAQLFATQDAKEGFSAFSMKRKPVFRGR